MAARQSSRGEGRSDSDEEEQNPSSCPTGDSSNNNDVANELDGIMESLLRPYPSSPPSTSTNPSPSSSGTSTPSYPGDSFSSSSSAVGSTTGNKEVQDALEEILHMSVRKAQVKEDILADLETKKQKLRSIGEELTEAFGREIELNKARLELDSNMNLAETLERFKEVEDEVQAVRDRLKADKEELLEWEERTAMARNQGLFFQKLYKGPVREKKKKERGEGAGDDATASSDDAYDDDDDEVLSRGRAAVLSSIKQPAAKEVQSPWRMYVFIYLSGVTLLVLLQDLFGGGGSGASGSGSSGPSYGIDALYGAITITMMYSAWSERKALAVDPAEPPPPPEQ